MTLNTADRKSVRAAEKAAAIADRERGEVIVALASTQAGRRFLWDKLTSAHIFQTSFNLDSGQMAFAEGERNQGLLLLNDIIQWCPDQFILAMREHNGRSSSNDSASRDTGQRGGGANGNGRDSGSADEAASGLGESGDGEDSGDEARLN